MSNQRTVFSKITEENKTPQQTKAEAVKKLQNLRNSQKEAAGIKRNQQLKPQLVAKRKQESKLGYILGTVAVLAILIGVFMGYNSIQNLNNKIISLQVQNKELKERQQEYETVISNLRSEVDEMYAMNSKLTYENDSLVSENTFLIKKAQAMQQLVESTARDNRLYSEKARHYRSLYAQASAYHDQLLGRIDSLEKVLHVDPSFRKPVSEGEDLLYNVKTLDGQTVKFRLGVSNNQMVVKHLVVE